MAESNFLLVVYDISSDRRRTRLHNRLKDFGTPVQYSVFECVLDDEGVQKIKDAVGKIIKQRKDHVRFYPLCARCVEKINVSGGREITGEPPSALIVG